ncbi:MAG: hypothetical protein HY308_17805 [Gammaproteobacteria bacterium]|nr:hypothetical protein [Gammaproteobacteria bacterium]
MNRLSMIVALLLVCGSSNGVYAAQTVAHSASRFSMSGTVRSVDAAHEQISINDRRYRLASTLRVYLPDGKPASVDILQHEKRIRFNTQMNSATGELYITEIQIVPIN